MTDTKKDCIIKMSEGAIGAMNVCMQLLDKGGTIDPDAWAGGFGNLLFLDALNIYGTRIWMLFKDVCGQDLVKTVAMLRAYQCGYVTRGQLDHAIDNHGEGIVVDALLAQVKERLPNFGK
jgi:hypothetical protein